MTIQQAAQNALDVQDAINISGIAHTMIKCIRAINTRGENEHPIVTLFLLKMAELNGCGSTLNSAYDKAEQACKEIAAS